MYRNARHIFLRHLTRLSIAGSVLAACVDEDDLQSPWPAWEQGLMVQPAIVGSSIETRAYDYYDDNSYNINDDVPADDELKENDLGTRLDVFIAGQGSDPFWMQYHLVQGQPTVQDVTANVLNETADLLAKNYTDVTDPNGKKLVSGRKYDVYVAVNNTATNANIASKADLLALTYQNEKVHKLYGSTSSGSFDSERRMLMEGHVEWTCTSEPLQKITVPLKRAEVKVVVTVDISPAFLAQLRAETGLATPIGTPTAASPYKGAPQWKYVNWCMDTKVFADGNDITPTLLTDPERENMTENTTLNGQPYFYYNGKEKDEQGTLSNNTTTEVYFTDNIDDTDEYGRRYIELYPKAETLSDGHSVQRTANGVPRSRLITYTYASTWGDEAQEKAPYILISYPFYSKKTGVTEVNSSDDLVTSYNYYRIPVCDERTNTELKRNYIYKVNAIISGAGSTSFTDNETPVKLRYEVLPWTQDANETVKVKGENFHYFYVTPTTYSLRGNDTQSVNLNYYAATGDVVKFRNLQVYYYNSSGTKVDIYTSTNTENSNGLTTKSLTNNDAGRNYNVTINSDGTISVSSEALDNRAVKYISFQAYMTYVDEDGNTKTITQDIVIKHFPLDNIQNVEGWWSSRIDDAKVSITTTSTEVNYNSAGSGTGWVEGTMEFSTQQPQNWQTNGWLRQYGYWYRRNGNQYEYSLTQRNGWTSVRNSYIYYRTPYIRTITEYNDYSWVRWGENSSDYRAAYSDIMQAKVFYNGSIYFISDNDCLPTSNQVNGFDKYNRSHDYFGYYDDYYIKDGLWHYHNHKRDNSISNRYISPYAYANSSTNYALNPPGWDYYANYYMDNDGSVYEDYIEFGGFVKKTIRGDEYGLTNNHMYIIQISSTSDQYVLGRPIVNQTTHLSTDHVVSPAFMIASQLGALSKGSTTDANLAAKHCAEYMEVATDGTRYEGWRLPTKEEIAVIIKYQNTVSETMATVLSDCNYYALDGSASWTGIWEDNEENRNRIPFIRCVRDLSPEEVEAINSKQ